MGFRVFIVILPSGDRGRTPEGELLRPYDLKLVRFYVHEGLVLVDLRHIGW